MLSLCNKKEKFFHFHGNRQQNGKIPDIIVSISKKAPQVLKNRGFNYIMILM